jgi:integrase
VAKLTKSYIDRIPLPSATDTGKATQTFYRDDALPGFGLRVGSGGTKAFFIERRVNGRVKRISIGRYGTLTPTQARTKAQEMLGDIAMGNNPAAKKQAIKAQNITLELAFQDYLTVRKDLKEGTLKNYRKCIYGCLADWQPKRLVDITKDMVEQRHRDLGQKAPARANNTMRVLRAIFNHAIAKYEYTNGEPILTINPVDRLSQSRAWYTDEKRRTLLAAHELNDWHQATLALSYDVTRNYLHFLLFTGLRKMEAASLTWKQVDFKAGTFTITETKNRAPHTLPLTDALVNLLKHRLKYSGGSPWVFPSPLHEGEHLREPRGATEIIGKALGRPFKLHDLRRTFITIAESLDIPAYALKQLINHKNPNDVTAGYIVSNIERLRKPMQQITDFISEKTQDDTLSDQ